VPEIPRRRLRRTWLRRTLPAGVAAILVVGGTVVVRNSASASPIDTYRTTTVTTGSVDQRLNLTGSAQRVNQVSQGFAVTGTVSSVSVAVGDTVTAGEALATLDPTPLHSAVISAKASLAKAKATLESDQSATTTPTTTTGGTNGTSGTSGPSLATATTPVSTPGATATPTTTPRAAGPSGRSGSGTSLAQAQQRVTSAQRAITTDLQQASAALAQCGPFFPSESPTSGASPTTSMPSATTTPTATPTSNSTSGPTPTSTSTSTATPTSTTTASTSTPSDAEIKACVSALRTAPTQQQIQRHQQALTDSQSALMATVTLAITTATNTANTPGTTSPSTSTGQSSTSQSAAGGSSGSQSAAAQSSGGLSSGTGQSSASRAVTDQAAVTNAEAALSSAQADLTSATLKSSIGGTVGSVSLVKGASSQGKSVVIVGTGAVEVTVNVPLASIGTVHVGQKANVTPQGATSIAAGSVTSISLLPSTSSSSTGTGSGTGQGTSTTSSPTYPVVVLVPDALPALATGSRADVSLLIGTVSTVLTVPNSALTPLAKGQAMAVTLKNGVATAALVKTGYAGTLTTQVTSGLSAGQQVVLADLNTALPTNTTSPRRFGVAGGSAGGLGGAGFGGGPLPGGTGFPPPPG